MNLIDKHDWYNSMDTLNQFEIEYERAINGMLSDEGFLDCALGLHTMQGECDPVRECGATRQGLAVDWSGTLFPCLRFVELGEQWAIGDVYEGVGSVKEKSIRELINISINKNALACSKDCNYCPVSMFQRDTENVISHPEGWCKLLEIKQKIVAKYYYEIQEFKNQFFNN